jgi:hypothetical protein
VCMGQTYEPRQEHLLWLRQDLHWQLAHVCGNLCWKPMPLCWMLPA